MWSQLSIVGVVSFANSGCGLNDWGEKMYMYFFTQPYHHTVMGGVRAFPFCIIVTSLRWLQNDGTRGFSVDQLKGNDSCLSPSESWSTENPLIPSSLKSLTVAIFTSHISIHLFCSFGSAIYTVIYV